MVKKPKSLAMKNRDRFRDFADEYVFSYKGLFEK